MTDLLCCNPSSLCFKKNYAQGNSSGMYTLSGQSHEGRFWAAGKQQPHCLGCVLSPRAVSTFTQRLQRMGLCWTLSSSPSSFLCSSSWVSFKKKSLFHKLHGSDNHNIWWFQLHWVNRVSEADFFPIFRSLPVFCPSAVSGRTGFATTTTGKAVSPETTVCQAPSVLSSSNTLKKTVVRLQSHFLLNTLWECLVCRGKLKGKSLTCDILEGASHTAGIPPLFIALQNLMQNLSKGLLQKQSLFPKPNRTVFIYKDNRQDYSTDIARAIGLLGLILLKQLKNQQGHTCVPQRKTGP